MAKKLRKTLREIPIWDFILGKSEEKDPLGTQESPLGKKAKDEDTDDDGQDGEDHPITLRK